MMLFIGLIILLLLVCLDLVIAWFVIKLAFFGVLFLIFAVMYPEQVFKNPQPIPGIPMQDYTTSDPGQMFGIYMLLFLVFCGIMAYRQSKEEDK